MNLIQKGYDCSFEMNIFINIFFKKEEDGTIITVFNHENDRITVDTEIEFEGKKYIGFYEREFKNSEKDERLIKKIYGCACMRSFCDAAQKIR